MENNLEDILFLMDKYTSSNNEELDEQDDAAASGGGTSGYPTVTKWETGLTRSVANTIDCNAFLLWAIAFLIFTIFPFT